jgi:predicted short-subunit dehydrogenase-like oxidoreductase (DUF2520 family)
MAPGAEGARDLAGARVAVLGCGAVGGALAVELTLAGADLVLWSRSEERARALARHLAFGAAPTLAPDPGTALAGVEVALLTVTDEALEAFAASLPAPAPAAESGPEAPAAFHTNGARGLTVLEPLRGLGWGVGKLHPLQAVPATPDGGPPGRLWGAWFATAASPGAEELLARTLRSVGGRSLALGAEEDSLRLHAAAALLSGGLVALFDAALAAARAGSLDPDRTRAALLSLLRSTAANLEVHEPAEALTGPAARGAAGVVERHLTVLASEPGARDLYRALGRRMLELVGERLPDGTRDELTRLLG